MYRIKRERRAVSGPIDHKHVEKTLGNEMIEIRPTEGDQRHIDTEWARIEKRLHGQNHSIHWIFVETLYEANHNAALKHQRIVHLFASVDDNGNVKEVCMTSASS
jgi:hypothetical protein